MKTFHQLWVFRFSSYQFGVRKLFDMFGLNAIFKHLSILIELI